MKFFTYKNNTLFCEDVKLADVVKKYGTPTYVYSQNAILDRFNKLQNAFTTIKPLVCYSVKASSNIALLRLLVKAGAGLDIVSGGELYRAKKARVPMKRVVFAGVGKTEQEISNAIKSSILFLNVESEPELQRIDKLARKLRRKVSVALRLNPDVESHTHHYITTAKKENKFGIDFHTAQKIFKSQKKYKNVQIRCIHLHIGSQLTKVSPFSQALEKTVDFLQKNKKYVQIDTINLGGGIGIIYSDETPIKLSDYAKRIESVLTKHKYALILEPGRFIMGNSGALISTVQYIKNTKAKHFAIVDAAMNDLIRPSLYQAYHSILPIQRKNDRSKVIYDIVGPICESGDFFAKSRKMPKLEQEDVIALMSAGAYGFTMSSNYNTRRRGCELLIDGTRVSVIRKRETYEDILRGENVPTYLQ